MLTRRRTGLRAPTSFPQGVAYIAGNQDPARAIAAALDHACGAFRNPKVDVIFWAFDLKKDDRYDQFKTEGAVFDRAFWGRELTGCTSAGMFLGIPTQALQTRNFRKVGDFQFCIKCVVRSLRPYESS